MKKNYLLLLLTFISFASFAQIINEFQPNPAGTETGNLPFEFKGAPTTSFSGFLISIESDGANGLVDRSAAVSGMFDANGLFVVDLPDLENPSFTLVLCSTDPGIGADLDANDDGTFEDISSLGTIYDAIGIPDNDADAIITSGYATQLGGVSFAYTSDEPGLVFRDGTTNEWYALNEPFDPLFVYDINANTVFASDFSPEPTLAGTFGAVNPIYTMPTDPTITITSPNEGDIFAPGTTTVDVAYSAINVPQAATIEVTVNADTPVTTTDNPYAVQTADGQSYTVTVAIILAGVIASDQVTFSVSSITQVSDLAGLRAGTEGEYYELTGEALLTYQQTFRGQKFIEDASGGILIDDDNGIIMTTYSIGDGITGITGQLNSFSGMMQFVPSQDPGAPSSMGNTLTPQSVTLAMLTANPEQYESELVQVLAVTMDNTVPTFTTGTEFAMTQGADNFNFRTTFFSSDYIGANVPTTATDIIGIINERSGNTYFLTARESDDFSVELLSVDDFNSNSFAVYPNPTSTGFVHVVGVNDNAISVSVYDILGKQVINQTLTNNRVDVSALNAGLYILKISQNDASVTKKLVIK